MNRRLKGLIAMTLFAVVVVVVYYFYVNKENEGNAGLKDLQVSEIDKMLNKDLEESYPYTVREVVQHFIRIQKCYYNEEWTEDELIKLMYKATELFDEELKAVNQFDEYYEDLKAEIDLYREDNKVINRVILEKASEVIYSTVDGQKYASINCIYYLKGDSGTSKVEETYILRKDESERWKILGWKEYEGSEWE